MIIAISGFGKVGSRVLRAALKDPDIKVQAIIEKNGYHLVGRQKKGVMVVDDVDSIGEVDVIIEFSTPEAVMEHVFWAKENKVAMLVTATDLNNAQISELKKAAKEIPILLTSNVTLGTNILFDLLPKIAKMLIPVGWTYNITEIHRKIKKNRPSGTVLIAEGKIKEAINQKAEGIYSIRARNVAGIHKFKFFGPFGESIEIVHRLPSRKRKEDFALTTITLAKLLDGMPAGFYDMSGLISKN